MQRSEKTAQVESLQSAFNEARLVIVTSQTGLTVEESSELRAKIRGAGGSFRIAKNSLAKIASNDTPCASLKDYFAGPTGIAVANDDSVGLAKAIIDFTKDNEKLNVVAGVLDGKELPANDIIALSKLPSLDQLRGKLIGLIQAPATKVAGVVQAPAGQLARLMQAYASKG